MNDFVGGLFVVLVIVVLMVCYWAMMVMGFWLFAPMMICLVYTGGDLPTCSFNTWDSEGKNYFERENNELMT